VAKKINLSRFTLRIFNRLPAREMRITVPTLFTIARIAVTPIIVAAMIKSWWGTALLFFTFACLTDLIDGFLARALNVKTFLGACLDPIADKLLLIACFSTLAFVSTPVFAIPQAFVFFIMGKELLQLSGAGIIYWLQGHLDVKPTMLGKTTTCIQMLFIMWLFACYFFCWVPIKTYYVMLSILVIFMSVSLMQYIKIGVRMFKNKSDVR
jgi:cardiolipin synthase